MVHTTSQMIRTYVCCAHTRVLYIICMYMSCMFIVVYNIYYIYYILYAYVPHSTTSSSRLRTVPTVQKKYIKIPIYFHSLWCVHSIVVLYFLINKYISCKLHTCTNRTCVHKPATNRRLKCLVAELKLLSLALLFHISAVVCIDRDF